jgi:hypothetical protein
MTETEVSSEIAAAEGELDARSRRFWERILVKPALWSQDQYPGLASFWVVAILGNRCLYFNEVEKGWGWGRYSEWGRISEYQWQQDELQTIVAQTLFGIDRGGNG